MPQLKRDSVTLHYELNGEGPPAVYISGFSDHSNSVFGAGVRDTLGKGYRVLSVDNRGSGQTTVPAGASFTIDDLADDVAAVMDACDMDRAQVLGYSMGGCIAMTLALRHPQKVQALAVGVSMAVPPPPHSRSGFMLETVQIMRAQGVSQEIINRYTAVFLLNEDIFQIEPFMDAWVAAPPDPLAQSRTGFEQQSAALETYDIRDRLGDIEAPTLVISSPDDLLVPPRFQDEIAAGIPGASIKRYPGGHGFLGLPMYWEPAYRDLLAFWGQHAGN